MLYLLGLAESIDGKYLDLDLRPLVHALHLHRFQNRSPAVTARHDFILYVDGKEALATLTKTGLGSSRWNTAGGQGGGGFHAYMEHRGSHEYMEQQGVPHAHGETKRGSHAYIEYRGFPRVYGTQGVPRVHGTQGGLRGPHTHMRHWGFHTWAPPTHMEHRGAMLAL